jgi:hypothetical protein
MIALKKLGYVSLTLIAGIWICYGLHFVVARTFWPYLGLVAIALIVPAAPCTLVFVVAQFTGSPQ